MLLHFFQGRILHPVIQLFCWPPAWGCRFFLRTWFFIQLKQQVISWGCHKTWVITSRIVIVNIRWYLNILRLRGFWWGQTLIHRNVEGCHCDVTGRLVAMASLNYQSGVRCIVFKMDGFFLDICHYFWAWHGTCAQCMCSEQKPSVTVWHTSATVTQAWNIALCNAQAS